MLLAAAAFAFLARPAAASAHLRSGTVAVDYRVSVRASDTLAYTAQIYQSDHGLNVTIKPGHTVALLGYLQEPVFRLDSAGLWVNVASPTAVVVGLLAKKARIIAAAPRWRLQRGRRSALWHDARAQGLPPGVDRGVWSVPLLVDGRPARLEGELQRFPAPSLWPWLGILACVLAAAASPVVLHRRALVPRAAIAFAVGAAAASVVIALAFALDGYASPGTWIEGLDEIAFLAVGIGVLIRGPENWHAAAAVGLGLVGLAVGISKGAIFLHPIVLAVLPATLIRLVVLTALSAGLAAGALGCLCYGETVGPQRESGDQVGPTPRFPPAASGY